MSRPKMICGVVINMLVAFGIQSGRWAVGQDVSVNNIDSTPPFSATSDDFIRKAFLTVGRDVRVPLENGVPSATGQGNRKKAKIVNVDEWPYIDVTYTFGGIERRERTLADFLQVDTSIKLESFVLKGHEREVGGLSFSKNGSTLASLSPADGHIKIWNMSTRALHLRYRIEEDGVSQSAENGELTSLDGGGLALRLGKRLYLMADEEQYRRPTLWSDRIHSYGVSPDGKILATIEPAERNDEGATVRVDVCRVKDILADPDHVQKKVTMLKQTEIARVDRVAVSEDGALVIFACRAPSVVSHAELFLTTVVGERWIISESSKHNLNGDAIAISNYPDPLHYKPESFVYGNQIFDVVYEDKIRLRSNPISKEPTIKLSTALAGMTVDDGRNMTCAAFESNNGWLVTGHRDGQLNFYKTSDGTELASVQASKFEIRALAISPNGQMVATTDGSDIVVWTIPQLVP